MVSHKRVVKLKLFKIVAVDQCAMDAVAASAFVSLEAIRADIRHGGNRITFVVGVVWFRCTHGRIQGQASPGLIHAVLIRPF